MDRAVREFLTGHTFKRVCSAQRERVKPRQGVGANTLNFPRNGTVGFIDWLGRGAGKARQMRVIVTSRAQTFSCISPFLYPTTADF